MKSIFRYSSSMSVVVRELKLQPITNGCPKRFRRRSPCDIPHARLEPRPCFDIRKVSIELGGACHAKLIRSFLFTHYWPREPSVVGLWMPLDSRYLETLTDKYANSGDRLLAFEQIERTQERRLIGVAVANKTCPWAVDELEEWAHFTRSRPEKYRLYFQAHCLKSPNLYKQFGVSSLYDVEVLGTTADVSGQGVGTLLLRAVLKHALDSRHPIVQVASTNYYSHRVCERCGMKRAWSMKYTDFVDDDGKCVFFPRRPHTNVCLYMNTLKELDKPPCLPQLKL